MDAFYQQYQLGETLGEGGFGRVYRCQNKSSGLIFAVKTVDPSKLRNADDKEKVENEISICRNLDHGHIVRLLHSFSETGKYMMVFELLEGGELFDIISTRATYCELDASHCIEQLLLALSYLSSKRIVHRDVKPDNLMLVRPPANGSLKGTRLKLVDFGIAKRIPGNQDRISCDTSGTPYFLAPETLKQDLLGCPVDIWAAGVILYVLLVGNLPFWMGEKGKGEMLWKIVKGEYSMEESDWETVSDGAKQLVSYMLTIDQDARITADEALQCKWIRNSGRVSTLERRGTLCRLRAFNAKRKLRSAIFAVIAQRRLKSVTPPCSRGSKRHENGLESSGDELGSESESSVVDDGEVTDGPKVAVKSGRSSDCRKWSDSYIKPSQLLLDSSLQVRNSSDSGESGVCVSPVIDGPTNDFMGTADSDVVLRQGRRRMSPEKRHELQKRRRSIKDVVKDLKL